jgi:hypothetical protein
MDCYYPNLFYNLFNFFSRNETFSRRLEKYSSAFNYHTYHDFFVFFMFKIELKTKYTDEYVQVLYSPFHWKPKKIYWKDVVHFETRNADSFSEYYWGWGRGIKGARKNRAYIAYGDYGLQLTFKNGYRLFIGSQNKEELEKVVVELKV